MTIEDLVAHKVGTKITLGDGKQRVLKGDKKGFYVLKDSVKCYVEYNKHSDTFTVTGEWGHKNSK